MLVILNVICSFLAYSVEHAGLWQALLTYAQLMSILGMLDVKWPSILQGLFKAVSWITHIAPKVDTHVALAACVFGHFCIVQHLFAIGELHVTSGIQHVACITAHA